MNPSKWNLAFITMLTLISTGSPASNGPQHPQKRQVPMANQSLSAQPYWEHILREFVFKTISPPGNNQLYKRLLDAPFYAGPFPILSNDVSSVVLSRGDVYYLPNGHWLFCQEGCIDCEVCSEYTHPIVRWVLRRLRRYSTQGSTRHDLQLTVIPQTDGSYHMRNLSPRSYVYVTSQGEQVAYWNDKLAHHGSGAYGNLEEGVFGPKEKSFWKYVQRDSGERRNYTAWNDTVVRHRNDTVAQKHETIAPKHDTVVVKHDTIVKHKNDTIVAKRKNDTVATKHETITKQKNDTVAVPSEKPKINSEAVSLEKIPLKDSKQRPHVTDFDKNVTSSRNESGNRLKQLVPKLILGTDQLGQKHLVHVVPADGSTNATSINSVAPNALNFTGQSKNAYQRILRRIFDSLNSNRRSIESFLEPLAQAKANRQNEEHQQEETRNGVIGLKELARLYPVLGNRIRNETSLHNRWPATLNWKRQRRKSNDEIFASSFINSTDNSNASNGYNLNREIQNLSNSVINQYVSNRNGSVRYHSGIVKRD
ncbi:uncharacterized protein LOC100884006 [Megachile rotundata]|uniref:uncharacterized protein LOC100884006 n=1 Tax=Megachile rotundata TaxID=143995 RepID=UPI003FD24924